jgi:hypothetical protein
VSDTLKKKKAILNKICKNLSSFYPAHHEKFMCPTCLNIVHLKESNNITEAHIIPRYSGGKLKTYLCKNCNSKFGAKQDKWFGEFVRLNEEGKGVFNTNKQSGYLHINGIKVGGKFRVSPDGEGLDIAIMIARTSPEALKKLDESGNFLEFKIGIPLEENKKLVYVGFLTAAYLMWFKELGYSWVLQDHLDIVRKQIMNPDKDVIPGSYIMTLDGGEFTKPTIGVLYYEDFIGLVMGLSNIMVLLPPADKENFYGHFPSNLSHLTEKNIEGMSFCKKHEFEGPTGVLYKDRMVVVPKQFKDRSIEPYFLYFPGEGSKPQVMKPTSKKEYEKVSKEEGVINLRMGPR